MWDIYSHSEDVKIERAIAFLSKHYFASNHNPKPVLIHSLRVAMLLDMQNEDADVVVAALLHDLLEDTDCTAGEIARDFGEEVAILVQACSFNPIIKNYTEQYQEHFLRIADNPKALLIKTADILDNRRYAKLGDNALLNAKHKFFVQIAKPALQNHPLFILLQRNIA